VSTLAAAADVALDCSISQELVRWDWLPRLRLRQCCFGRALAVALSERRGFKEEDLPIASWGKLGKRLARVEALMHRGSYPRVTAATKMPDVIYEMSRRSWG